MYIYGLVNLLGEGNTLSLCRFNNQVWFVTIHLFCWSYCPLLMRWVKVYTLENLGCRFAAWLGLASSTSHRSQDTVKWGWAEGHDINNSEDWDVDFVILVVDHVRLFRVVFHRSKWTLLNAQVASMMGWYCSGTAWRMDNANAESNNVYGRWFLSSFSSGEYFG